ncbi:MAG TPA: LpqB family beta-propeller domain-containing protein, partial [Blastocatellia bacterium]|nr:LpqB family beta-propeller domain-containing protein [Blastocatellia bacterium]
EKVDARTDIFSFGVMLYEMLAGRAPFAGATASETIAAILRDEPLTLSKHAPDTPTELQRIVSKALRKERDERYQTVKDLLLDLKGVQQEISAPTIRTTVERETKRQPAWLLPTLISLVVLLLAAGAFWFVKWRGSVGEARPDERPVIVKTTQLTFWKGLDFYPALSPDGKTIAFSSDRSGSFEIYTKQLVAGAREMPITTDGGHNFQPTFSPDGNFIAYHSKKRGGIWVVPATGGAARRLTEFGAHPAWSPGDGAQLAFQSETFQMIGYRTLNVARTSTLWTVSSQGGEPRQLTHAGAQPGGHGAPAWSPDGKRLVFDAAGVVWSVSAQGDDLKKLSAPVKGALGAVYAPDGQSVYFTADDGWSLYHVSLSAAGDPVGEPALVFSGSGSHINKLSLAANGKSLVYAALTTSSNIWAQPLAPKTYAVSGKPVQLTQTANTCDVAPVYSPDGKTIAYFTFATGAPRQLWTMGVDGNNQTQIPAVTGSFPSWFPDGKRLTFRSSQDGLWAVSLEGGQGQKIFSFDGDTDEAVLTPDGQHVAFISRRGGAPNLWVAPLAGGAPKQLTFEQEAVSHPAWSRDGKWLAFELKRGRDGHVAIISSEGGAPVQLTSVPGLSLVSDWSPDGQRILFAGQRAGVWNVWSVARADKRQQQLTSYTKFDSYVRGPAWSPRGEQIVYEYAENTGNIWLMELK